MKVLHVSPSFARREGGPSEVLRGLLPVLASKGVEWTVATTDKGVVSADDEFGGQANVHVFRSKWLPRWTFSAAMLFALPRLIRANDVVHIHSVHTFPSSIAMRISARLKVPYVLEPHGALDKFHIGQGGVKKRLYSALVDSRGVRSLSGAIYSSEIEETEGTAFWPRVAAMQMTLGVSPDLLEAETATIREDTVLFLGRVTEKKRLDLVIAAMQSERFPASLRLIVAGPLDPRLSYDPVKLVKDAGLSARVSFLGQVDSARRLDLLTTALVFVLPSEDESFGMAVAEAMASGCRVISTSRVGSAVAAAAGGGLRMTRLDADDLAENVASVSFSQAGSEMATIGRIFARENFTWDRAADQAIAIYRSLIASKNEKP